MTNERFASLHAGMLERGGTKAGNDTKLVKVVIPSEQSPNTEFGGFGTKSRPTRSLLDQAAGWISQPDRKPVEVEPGPDKRLAKTTRTVSQLPASVAAPKIAPATMAAARPRTAPPAVKRRAMTLRLDGDSHIRLRHASRHMGRTCQDILFVAMNRYLDALGFKE
ncbi:MAG: hypothetical protein VCD66_02825 [Alphaproteobacteria bacterium]|jgi:hypothetical protein